MGAVAARRGQLHPSRTLFYHHGRARQGTCSSSDGSWPAALTHFYALQITANHEYLARRQCQQRKSDFTRFEQHRPHIVSSRILVPICSICV